MTIYEIYLNSLDWNTQASIGALSSLLIIISISLLFLLKKNMGNDGIY